MSEDQYDINDVPMGDGAPPTEPDPDAPDLNTMPDPATVPQPEDVAPDLPDQSSREGA